jgi:hypothetical protein
VIERQSEDTREAIRSTGNSLIELLIEKNRRYGDSALNPPRIFGKSDATDSIGVRLDDKIGRIANAEEPRRNDVADIMGYLVLYCVARGWTDFSDLID